MDTLPAALQVPRDPARGLKFLLRNSLRLRQSRLPDFLTTSNRRPPSCEDVAAGLLGANALYQAGLDEWLEGVESALLRDAQRVPELLWSRSPAGRESNCSCLGHRTGFFCFVWAVNFYARVQTRSRVSESPSAQPVGVNARAGAG